MAVMIPLCATILPFPVILRRRIKPEEGRRQIIFRIFICSCEQRSSGLLATIAAAVRALCVLEQAVTATAVAPPMRVRSAHRSAKPRENPGIFCKPGQVPGIVGYYPVLF